MVVCLTRNVVHKPCTEQGCTTLAVFNEPGAGHGLYCGQHKPPGFINVKVRARMGLRRHLLPIPVHLRSCMLALESLLPTYLSWSWEAALRQVPWRGRRALMLTFIITAAAVCCINQDLSGR